MKILRKTGVFLEKGIHGLSSLLSVISMVVLFLMMFFVPADVFGRYILKTPIYGDLEYQQLAMVLIVFLALPFCTYKKVHIFVELLVSRLSGRVLAAVQSLACLIGLVIIALISWYIGKFGLSELYSSSGSTTTMVSIPFAPFIIIASFGCLIMALETAIELVYSVSRVIKNP